MSAKAKAQLAGQTVGVIGGSSGIGLETTLPFCLYSPECVEEEFSEVRIQHPAYLRPYETGGWPIAPPEYRRAPTRCGGVG